MMRVTYFFFAMSTASSPVRRSRNRSFDRPRNTRITPKKNQKPRLRIAEFKDGSSKVVACKALRIFALFRVIRGPSKIFGEKQDFELWRCGGAEAFHLRAFSETCIALLRSTFVVIRISKRGRVRSTVRFT
jgi:hypothetical protein